jgi:glutaredoxin 3
MPTIEMYTTPSCPYCHAAKDLLHKKGVKFNEINVMGDVAKRQEMVKRANGRMTVPQIFINETHVGGCDDLYDLDHEGKLDPLLTATA